MKREYNSKCNVKLLKLLASNKTMLEKETFYEPYFEEIMLYFSSLNIIQLTACIERETDSYLQELQCEVLASKLVDYTGPITLEYLQFLFSICPVSGVWKLAVEAKSSMVKEIAKERLNQILDEYGYKKRKINQKKKRGRKNDKY